MAQRPRVKPSRTDQKQNKRNFKKRKEKSGGMFWEFTQQENMLARLAIPHT